MQGHSKLNTQTDFLLLLLLVACCCSLLIESCSFLNNYLVLVPRENLKLEELSALLRLQQTVKSRENVTERLEWGVLQDLEQRFGKQRLDYLSEIKVHCLLLLPILA